MQSQFNMRNPAVKRLMKEAQELKDATAQFHAQPLEDNLFEWHFTIRGPADTDFGGGIYHGRIILPPEYPMKPPSIILMTPNGRFELNTKICLSISGHHPESWRPSWSIRTALLAIIGFMPTHGGGALGSLNYTADERIKLANRSQNWKCPQCGIVKYLVKPETETSNSKETEKEAKELASQISFKGETHTKVSDDKPSLSKAESCETDGVPSQSQNGEIPVSTSPQQTTGSPIQPQFPPVMSPHMPFPFPTTGQMQFPFPTSGQIPFPFPTPGQMPFPPFFNPYMCNLGVNQQQQRPQLPSYMGAFPPMMPFMYPPHFMMQGSLQRAAFPDIQNSSRNIPQMNMNNVHQSVPSQLENSEEILRQVDQTNSLHAQTDLRHRNVAGNAANGTDRATNQNNGNIVQQMPNAGVDWYSVVFLVLCSLGFAILMLRRLNVIDFDELADWLFNIPP